MTYTNKLINETSPYLLQHAHNPVHWFPWGEDALQLAKEENKPILVSIGYSACHWCHVMERESFENVEVAQIMNANFVNIKIDREERPDLDHIYMDAVQAMTGSGGWPLNVFLTPDAKPFYGGTYFPPKKAYNRPSWMETLQSVTHTFNQKRHEVDAQAENLTAHLLKSNEFALQDSAISIFGKDKMIQAVQQLMKQADEQWGGFGKAPKFPQSFSTQFLLRYAYVHEGEAGKESAFAKQQALLSLNKMIDGGIYDQIGGGFSRYSTDTEWLAPHFEKMLYDNALLVAVMSEAYQFTKNKKYHKAIVETMEFVKRELLHENGGFYAALDADSEGVEGKFYVWQKAEVEEVIGTIDPSLFCEYYDITNEGNWDGTNILRIKKPMSAFAKEIGITEAVFLEQIENAKQLLLDRRATRIRPQLDDKIILGWNMLMNSACSKAYAATGKEDYKQLAEKNMIFALKAFEGKEKGELFHTFKNNQAKYPAFLDDYAFLIEALLHLQEITSETQWLKQAAIFAQTVISKFSDEEGLYFYYTSSSQKDIIVRKKELYDGATASGNSVMAYNLYRLGILLDNMDWKERAVSMIIGVQKAIITYPSSFGNWCNLLQEMQNGTQEIVVTGLDIEKISKEFFSYYLPHKVVMLTNKESLEFPLLMGKTVDKDPTFYCCSNYTCEKPVFSINDLLSVVNGGIDNN